MISERRAVIDVGTNSVKLLVADVSGQSVAPLIEKSQQTRLGAGFYESHHLQRAAIERTARAVSEFATEATEWQPKVIRVIATSAARDALNQEELISAIQQSSGLSVEIISGEQEADWVFAGVTSDPSLASQSLLIVDVGGGSTEFILSRENSQTFRQSFLIGTVRLLEQIRPSDPPKESQWQDCCTRLQDFIRTQIEPVIREARSKFSSSPLSLIVAGGTASILAAMQLQLTSFDRQRIEALRLTRDDVCSRQKQLWKLSLEERKSLPGLPANRADVILTGVAILAAIMEQFGFAEMRVSTRGLRFAAILDGA